MITLTAAEGAPRFADVESEPAPHSVPTSVGQIIIDALDAAVGSDRRIKVLKCVVMPDHLHIVLFVMEHLEKAIGSYIGKMKALATSATRARTGRPDLGLFESGFHDRVLIGMNQLERMLRYVEDNPRRLLIRQSSHGYFEYHRDIEIGGHRYDMVGNRFLLDEVDFLPVIVHRCWSDEEKLMALGRWISFARNGGVLVSPFISKSEKDVFAKAIANGGRAILLTKDELSPRYKPPGEKFDLCAEGRLLVMRPMNLPPGSCGGMSREEALALNQAARDISCALGH